MLTKSSLVKYLASNSVKWIPEMPDGVPPENIDIPEGHKFYRLTIGDTIAPSDILSYHELYPDRDWGEQTINSYGLSIIDDLNKVGKLKKIPSLRACKGISSIVLNPKDGVVLQTGKNNHYTWWRTSSFDISVAETVMAL